MNLKAWLEKHDFKNMIKKTLKFLSRYNEPPGMVIEGRLTMANNHCKPYRAHKKRLEKSSYKVRYGL